MNNKIPCTTSCVKCEIVLIYLSLEKSCLQNNLLQQYTAYMN